MINDVAAGILTNTVIKTSRVCCSSAWHKTTKITAAQWFDFFHHFSLAQLGAVGLLEEPKIKSVIRDECGE